MIELSEYIREVPDFPKPGILFRDITPLLASPAAFAETIKQLADRYRSQRINAVVAVESRGFIFGAPLALELGASFVPVRKPGKLPFEKISHSYDLEYGSDTLEMHNDALSAGQRVLLVDDVLATGGTIEACLKLLANFDVEIVECAFCINLAFLQGERRLKPHKAFSLMEF
jgi:adenine phosphoribosyltransferase